MTGISRNQRQTASIFHFASLSMRLPNQTRSMKLGLHSKGRECVKVVPFVLLAFPSHIRIRLDMYHLRCSAGGRGLFCGGEKKTKYLQRSNMTKTGIISDFITESGLKWGKTTFKRGKKSGVEEVTRSSLQGVSTRDI